MRSLGSTAKASTRPEVTAGPIERKRNPPNACEPIGSGGGGGVGATVGETDGVGDAVVTRVASPAGVGDEVGGGPDGLCPKKVAVNTSDKQTRTNDERSLCTVKAPNE